MSVRVLKQYINEVLRVTVQRVEAAEDGEKEKTSYTKTFDISDDDSDELDWFLDNYGKPPINLKKKSQKDPVTGKRKYVKVYDETSELQISEVLDELEEIAASQKKSLDKNLLSSVIRPWGDKGFKALKYILTYTRRTGKTFPFFEYADQAAVGSSFNLASVDISDQLLNHLMNVTPKIGRNDTGQGEFVIALLTGGIAGATGLYGDIEIGSDNWEVKVPSSNGVVRLGDLSSGVFRRKLKELAAAKIDRSFLTADDIFDLITTYESYVSLIKRGEDERVAQVLDVIDEATNHMLQEMKVTGFVLLFSKDKVVRFVSNSTDAWEFYNAGGKSSGRIHIKLK